MYGHKPHDFFDQIIAKTFTTGKVLWLKELWLGQNKFCGCK